MVSVKIILIAVLALVSAVISLVITRAPTITDENNLPKFIQADFVNLSQIYSISKFRSGEGHDFSGGGETCRSMKHYFTPQYNPNVQWREVDGKRLPPLPDGITDILIYSPVDGKISSIGEEHTPIGKQVAIIPDSQPYLIRLFHIYLSPDIKSGTHVKAGQQIGVIGKNQGTDIAIQAGTLPWNDKFISYFQVMPDSVFAAYQARGATSRDDFIISKEYRDAHPLQCANDEGENFIYPADYNRAEDDFHLRGYVYLEPDYKKQQQNSSIG